MEGGYGRFDGYYAKYKEYVTKNLMKLTKGDKQLTEDLSQEVWLAFYREMDQVIPIGDDGIRGWLYMVGRRKFLDNMDPRLPEQGNVRGGHENRRKSAR